MSYGDGGFYFTGPVNGDYGDGGFYFTGPVNGDYSGFDASPVVKRGKFRPSSYGAASDAINWTGKGDYQYSIDINGTITILNTGKKLTPGLNPTAYNAIIDEADTLYPAKSLQILARADKAWAAYRNAQKGKAPSSTPSAALEEAMQSADKKGGVLTYVAIGIAGVAVIGIGYFAYQAYSKKV